MLVKSLYGWEATEWVPDAPQSQRRWQTLEAVHARINELKLTPIRTKPTNFALNYRPLPFTPCFIRNKRGRSYVYLKPPSSLHREKPTCTPLMPRTSTLLMSKG